MGSADTDGRADGLSEGMDDVVGRADGLIEGMDDGANVSTTQYSGSVVLVSTGTSK